MVIMSYEETNRINNVLISAVSHELRTPIAAIKGYSTMLLDYFPELTVKETKEYIQSIDNATDRLTRLVENLLDTSRLEAGLLKLEKTKVNIASLIKAAVKEAETSDKHHKIITVLDNNTTMVYIDPKLIRQVLDNLLENAAKCSPKGTEILISTNNNGQELKISVTDHGTWTPAGDLNSICEHMNGSEEKASPGTNGIGLRLYICQRLIAAHGGRMRAEAADKGNAVQFTLPLTPVKSKEKLIYV
ncbi:MAG: hypothetical protein A2Y58_01320 [Chloroflexi bacterium RBG_13_51_52]|nr:MAG: hypothetical protein A2Y58_01320 [Chloroflexi bacterium RBG_13_51_52]